MELHTPPLSPAPRSLATFQQGRKQSIIYLFVSFSIICVSETTMYPILGAGMLAVQMFWKGLGFEVALGQVWSLALGQMWFPFQKLPHYQKGSRMGRGSVVVYVGAQKGPVR